LWFIVEWVSMWKTVFEMSGSMVLILTLLMILSLAVVFGVINVILVKADQIAALPETKDYIVVPILVLFVKLLGELSVFIWTFIGIAGFLIALTDGGKMLLAMIPFIGFQSAFEGLVKALITGFFYFFMFYFFAEQIGALVDIARNTKK